MYFYYACNNVYKRLYRLNFKSITREELTTRKLIKLNKGFTLAELLISLSVLGLISALTLPNVFYNVNKQRDKAIFKEVNSILSDAVFRVVFDGRDYTSLRLLEMIEKTTNVVKMCNSDVKAQGCWTAGQPDDNEATEAGFMLHSGAQVYGIRPGVTGGSDAVWVDLNGFSGPNEVGKDIIKLHMCLIDNPDCYNWTAIGYAGKQGVGSVSPAAQQGGTLDIDHYNALTK